MNIKASLTLLIITALMTFGSHSKILYTFSIMRHGATYAPNDLYDGKETKQFRGKLTPIGLRQHYNLGTYLKQNYITEQNITSPKFNPNDVEFFSTSYSRSHRSALAFIYGFYPLAEGWTIPLEVPSDKLQPPYTPLFPTYLRQQQIGDEPFALNKGLQPLPVRQLDQILDNCPGYDHLINERKSLIASQVQTFEQQQKVLFSRMKSIFNLTNEQLNLPTISDLYETVIADLNLGRKMPTAFNQLDLKNLRYMNQFYNTLVFNGNFARVLTTPSIRLFRNKIQGATKNASLKLTFLFGHQSNLHPWLTLLNLTSTDCLTQQWKGQTMTHLNCVAPPQFAANMVIQLHQEGSAKFVRVRYNGYYVNLCEERASDCELSEFIGRIKNLETNYQAQCQINLNRKEIEEI